MKLYFDLGNSQLKICSIKNNHSYYWYIPTKNITSMSVFWKLLPEKLKVAPIKKIIFASVVPKKANFILQALKKHHFVKPLLVQAQLNLNLKLNVENPQILGADLIALATFASTLSKAVIIINLGTATTINYVKSKIFEGTIIMPGIQTQITCLISKAAKITQLNLATQKQIIGKNTSEAVTLGIIKSHIYALEAHVKNIDPQALVIISGNDAHWIAQDVAFKYVKEATIEGLKIIDQLN